MTRDELIQTMAKALADTDTIRQPHTNGHIYEASRLAEFMHARCKGVAAAALAAIEAQGLAICPVEARDAQADAMLDTGLVEDGVPGKSAYECARIVYRAMIDAGKL